VIEPEIKLVFLCLFVLMVLADLAKGHAVLPADAADEHRADVRHDLVAVRPERGEIVRSTPVGATEVHVFMNERGSVIDAQALLCPPVT
jgi:hypothetical protein